MSCFGSHPRTKPLPHKEGEAWTVLGEIGPDLEFAA